MFLILKDSFPWISTEPVSMEGQTLVLLLWVWPILGTVLTTHDIRKGILLQEHGEAVILDEYA